MDPSPHPALAGELLDLELALARRDLEALPAPPAELLDDEFVEVGQSGRRWDRDATLELLAADTKPAELAIEDFRVDLLSAGVALVTYRLEGRRAGGPTSASLRTSVWVRSERGWRLRFHQGTTLQR